MDDLIRKLSEIRSEYNCFNQDEEPYYRALSEVISILSRRTDGDTISRQAAIDALDAICGRECEYPKKQRAVMCAACHLGSAFDAIDELPSEERRGRWIRTGEDGYCSVCKCDMPMFRNDWEWEYTETPYCPNCGAQMSPPDEE